MAKDGRTDVPSKEYRDNWKDIFGKKPKPAKNQNSRHRGLTVMEEQLELFPEELDKDA